MMASGDGKSTWIKKLSDYNKNKTYFARIKQAKKTNKVAKKYIESKYGEDLDNLVSQWKELRERIKDYISTVEDINEKAEENNDSENIDVINDYFGVDTDTIDELNEEKIQNLGSDEVVESFEENAEQTKAFNDAEQFSETASVVSYLSSVKYGDGTLLDFFLLNPTDDTEDDSSIKSSLTTTLKGEDLKYECAAVFEAMTEAQADTLGEAINLFTAIKYAITDEKNVWNSLENADKKVYKTSLKEINKTSVYSGVDRDMFEDTVALTQAGQTVNKTVFEDVIEGNSGNKAKNITFLSVGAITTAIGLTILGAGVASYINDFQLFNKTTNTMWKNWLLDAERKFSDKFVSLIYGNPQNYIESVVEKMNSGVISVEQYNKALKNFLVVKHMATVVIGVAIAAIGIYFSVKAIIGLVDDRKVYYKGNYSIAIPKYMVDLNRDEDNSVYFNYYKVAMCNRNDEDMTGFKREEEGLKDYGDVNGDNGRQWVALYYSTAETAGDPILADSLEVKYGDTPYDDNYKQLHSFNEPATGFNLTSMVYCYNDKKGGTYLRYKVDKEADNTKITSKSDNNNSAQAASAFSGRGNVGIIVVSGIFGIVLGFFGARLTSQKKKEE